MVSEKCKNILFNNKLLFKNKRREKKTQFNCDIWRDWLLNAAALLRMWGRRVLDNLRNVCTRLKKLKTTENFKLLICVKNMNFKNNIIYCWGRILVGGIRWLFLKFCILALSVYFLFCHHSIIHYGMSDYIHDNSWI